MAGHVGKRFLRLIKKLEKGWKPENLTGVVEKEFLEIGNLTLPSSLENQALYGC